MKLINDRYKLINIVDRDDFGVTYVASDFFKDNEKILLKILHKELSKSNLINDFIDEFKTIVSIKHKYILSNNNFDIIKKVNTTEIDSLQYFYTTDIIEGELLDYKSLSDKEINDVFLKICYALNYLHFRGITYKYLNFENFLIFKNSDGINVKLKDIAYIYQYGNDINRIDRFNKKFIAPEVNFKNQFGFASDIYSLGLLLYYLYNKIDYEEYEIEMSILESSRNEINEIILKMTALNLDDRYKSIPDFMSDFEKYFNIKYEFNDKEYYERLNFNTKLISREQEIDKSLKIIRDKLEGKTCLNSLFIHGEEGIGKSRFIKELSFLLRMQRVNICNIVLNKDNITSYHTFKEIIKCIIRNLNVNSDLINKYGDELAKILPSFAEKWNIISSKALGGEMEALRLNNRIYNFICDYASKNSLVVFIDNVQYANKNDIEILRDLIMKKNDIPLFVVCTYRDNEIIDNEYIKMWEKENNIEHIQIKKFDIDSTSQFMQYILGTGRKPLKESAEVLYEETAGNPGYIEEIVRNLYLKKLIYISDNRIWFVKADSMSDLHFPANVDSAVLSTINEFDSSTKKVLDVLSTFNIEVSFEVLKSFIEIEENELSEILSKLTELKIVNDNSINWVKKYEIFNTREKKSVYSKIDNKQKIYYHNQIAEMLEKYCQEDCTLKDELIYHLVKSQNYEKALEYCHIIAQEMKSLNLIDQALAYYDKAVDVMSNIDDKKLLFEIMVEIGKSYEYIDNMDRAYEYFEKALNIALVSDDKKAIIDSKNLLVEKYINQNEKAKAEKMIQESIQLSKDIDYFKGELDAILNKLLLFINMKYDMEKFKELYEFYLYNDYVKNNPYYKGLFLLVNIEYFYNTGQIDKLFTIAKECYVCFMRANAHAKAAIPLGYIGIYYTRKRNYPKAREYYERALEIKKEKNSLRWRIKFLIYISSSYGLEGNYKKAIEHFEYALAEADEIGYTGDRTVIYYYLLKLHCFLCQYDDAYFYLKKIVNAYENFCCGDDKNSSYYFGHINYYLHIENYYLAQEWFSKVREVLNEMPKHFKAVYQVKYLYLTYYMKKDITIADITEILNSHPDTVYLRFTRDALLDIALKLSKENNINSALEIIKFDEKYEDKHNNEILKVKKSFILGFKENNKVEFYQDLLEKIKENDMLEYYWTTSDILGDEYYKRGNYYKALNYYVTSFDVLKRLTYRLPKEYRENYLYSSKSKLLIKGKIITIINDICNNNISRIIYNSSRNFSSVNEYFDLTNIKEFFNNEKILDAIYDEYKKKFSIELVKIDDLIQNLGFDPIYNIKLTLDYCSLLSFADRACLYLVDEEHKIIKTISSENRNDIPDISNIINNNSQKAILYNYTFEKDDLINKNQEGDIKAYICIPIKKSRNKDYEKKDRRKRNYFEKRRIVGYLYLDTNMLINNFKHETLEKCRGLANLVSTLIENYKLSITSTMDNLTGLYLRNYFDDMLNNEFNYSKINKKSFSIIMGDIDNFKYINDTYGHVAGDEALVLIANTIKKNTRKTDLVGRYGGEEFIILLPNSDQKEAFQVCEKIRHKIEQIDFLDNKISLSLSLGIATFPNHGQTKEELVEKADQAMYYSKDTGKNKTIIWNDTIVSSKRRLHNKLTGIITGNISNDNRKVEAIINIISLLKKDMDKKNKLYNALKQINHECEAENSAIFEINNSEIEAIYAVERSKKGLISKFDYNKNIIKEYIDKDEGDYFIDWSNGAEISSITDTPNWMSIIIVPLVESGVKKGILMLQVPISEREFGVETYNFVDSINSIIASML